MSGTPARSYMLASSPTTRSTKRYVASTPDVDDIIAPHLHGLILRFVARIGQKESAAFFVATLLPQIAMPGFHALHGSSRVAGQIDLGYDRDVPRLGVAQYLYKVVLRVDSRSRAISWDRDGITGPEPSDGIRFSASSRV